MRYLLFLFIAFSYMYSFEIPNKVIVSAPKQDSGILQIPALDLKIGESGIITRDNGTNEFILYNAIVKDIQKGVAQVELAEFETIKQPYMPQPFGEVREKDKIIFRILYDRAIIITGNQNTYQEIATSNANIDFIHPDILATFLAKEGDDMPTQENLKKFCDRFNIGLVFLANSGEVHIFDCQSFAIIGRDSYGGTQDSSAALPFWTRISKGTLEEMFDMEDMPNFHAYYANLAANAVDSTKQDSMKDSSDEDEDSAESQDSFETESLQ